MYLYSVIVGLFETSGNSHFISLLLLFDLTAIGPLLRLWNWKRLQFFSSVDRIVSLAKISLTQTPSEHS